MNNKKIILIKTLFRKLRFRRICIQGTDEDQQKIKITLFQFLISIYSSNFVTKNHRFDFHDVKVNSF